MLREREGYEMRKSIMNTRFAVGFVSALCLLGLAGCSASTPAPDSTAMKQTELSFDLSKCQQLNPGLYSCPAVDKQVCSPDYVGTPVECLHTSKNGNITIQQLNQ